MSDEENENNTDIDRFYTKDALSVQTDNASMVVFILEDALSVQTDNASMVVFILRTHYPSRRIMRLWSFLY